MYASAKPSTVTIPLWIFLGAKAPLAHAKASALKERTIGLSFETFRCWRHRSGDNCWKSFETRRQLALQGKSMAPAAAVARKSGFSSKSWVL